jgi:hypothetical protein
MNCLLGIIPAVVTPVDEGERFRPSVFERLIDDVRAIRTAVDVSWKRRYRR